MTRRSFWMVMMLPVLAGLALLTAFSAAPVGPGGTWVILFGSPVSSGQHTTTIEFQYQDSTTKVHHKTVTSTVTIDDSMTPAQKKAAAQQALDAALADDTNQVGGTPLAQTGGTGNVITITPSDATGHTNTTIEKITMLDKETGENDRIVSPAVREVGMVYLAGEFIGQTADGAPSVCSVATNLGTVTVTLASDMTRLQVLEALSAGLRAQDPGVVTFVDPERLILLIPMDTLNGPIMGLGAGSTDAELITECSVLAADS